MASRVRPSILLHRSIDELNFVASYCQRAGYNSYAHLISLIDGLPSDNDGIRPNVNDSVLTQAGLVME